jgi:DNA-binding NarL/FixJ family response regulator
VSDLHVLLATNRPAIRSFFEHLHFSRDAGFALSHIPVELDALAMAPQALAEATVAVIDVGSEPGAAIALCSELHLRRPDLPAIGLVCCSHTVTFWQVQALANACVHSFLDLHASEDEIRRALRSIASGNIVLRLDLGREGQALLDSIAGRGQRRAARLTHYPVSEVDVQIVELVASGLSDREIAQRLHLSPHTVSHHVGRLSDQVGARNRTALAAWAGGHGFYRPSKALV